MKQVVTGLMGSRKAVVMAGLTILVFAGVYTGKVTWEKAISFLTIAAPAWLAAVGFEDFAKHTAAGKIEVARASMLPPPPAATTTPDVAGDK